MTESFDPKPEKTPPPAEPVRLPVKKPEWPVGRKQRELDIVSSQYPRKGRAGTGLPGKATGIGGVGGSFKVD
jgi:hypothetical protein